MGNTVGCCGWGFGSSLVTRAAFRPPQPPSVIRDTEAVVVIDVPNFGQVKALHYRPSREPRRRRRTVHMDDRPLDEGYLTILFSHGNGCDVGMVAGVAKVLSRRLEVDVIVYDYPGYGGNTRPPSEEGAFKAAHAAYDYAIDASAGTPQNLILYGVSIGSGVATELARTHECAALVLQSALRSAIRVAYPSLPFTLPCDIMTNEDKLTDVPRDVPLYIMHGDEDNLVNISHGKALYEIAMQHMSCVRYWWADEGGHDNLELNHDYYRRFKEFIDDEVRH